MSISMETERSAHPWESEPVPTITTAGLRAGRFENADEKAYWRSVKALEDLIGRISEFDRRSFDAARQKMSVTLERLADYLGGDERPAKDRLLRLTPFLENALAKIEKNPRTKLARRYEEVPLHKIRNQDTRCLMRLARRPGRTVVEKTARTKKAPAVVRYQSVNTPGNRLVRRLAAELLRALEARGEMEVQAGRQEVWEEETSELYSLCRRILRESPIGELSPPVVVESNNVLLGNPDYHTVFQAFRAFRRQQEDFEARWRRGVDYWARAIAWAIRAELAAIDDLCATSAVVRPSGEQAGGDGDADDGDDELFGLTTGQCWFFSQGTQNAAFHVDVKDGKVVIQRWSLSGEPLLTSAEPDEVWTISVEPAPSSMVDDGEPRRGYPVDLFCEARESGDLYALEERADQKGFARTGRWGVECMGLQPASRDRADDDRPGVADGHHRLGLSLAGPVARWSAQERQGEGGLLLVASAEEEQRGLWPTGRGAALALSPREDTWQRCAIRHFWKPSTRDESSEEGEFSESDDVQNHLRVAVEAAVERYVGVGADLAVATADGLDELELQRLRRLLPATGGECWLVWRSVAAALTWRQEHGGAVEEGDVVLVVDTGAPRCTATMLVGRREDGSEERDDWYWERPAPFTLATSAAPTAWKYREALADAMVAELSDPSLRDDIAARLIDEGHLEGLEVGAFVKIPLFHEKSPTMVRLQLRDCHRREALKAWREEFDAWTKAFADEGCVDILRRRVEREGGELHLLLAGGLFGREDCRERARRSFEEVLSDAKFHDPIDDILPGTTLFLERHEAGLPTWRDLIPELKLTVGSHRHKQDLDLLNPEVIEQGVRPGQMLSHEPEQRFELPAGAEVIEFPMKSGVDEEERGGDEYTAHLNHRALPLVDDLEVGLRVAYRYAEDAFRIFVVPTNGEGFSPPPFDEIQIEWRRGGGDVPEQEREVRNEPPQFQEPEGWDESEDQWGFWLPQLPSCRNETQEKIESFSNRSRLHSRLNRKADSVRKNLQDLCELLKEIDTYSGNVIPIERSLAPPPEEVADEVHRLCALLTALADIPNVDGRQKFPHEMLRKENYPGVKKADTELREIAIRTMGKLRHLSPPQLLELLRDGFENEKSSHQKQWRFETFGRALGDVRDEERKRFLNWFLEDLTRFIEDEFESNKPDPEVRHRLWAMATALWSNPEAIHQLTPAQAEELRDLLLRLARRIDAHWLEAGLSIEIFKELGLVTLAMLRLRGGPSGHLVEANNEFCEELADLMEAIDEATGFQANARIDVGEEIDAFGTLVAENLRGYRISRIRILEE